jgi:hypothetical protein
MVAFDKIQWQFLLVNEAPLVMLISSASCPYDFDNTFSCVPRGTLNACVRPPSAIVFHPLALISGTLLDAL